jgi:hypothetical protein
MCFGTCIITFFSFVFKISTIFDAELVWQWWIMTLQFYSGTHGGSLSACQPAVVVVVHEHPSWVDTVKLPVPPAGLKFLLVGVSV